MKEKKIKKEKVKENKKTYLKSTNYLYILLFKLISLILNLSHTD